MKRKAVLFGLVMILMLIIGCVSASAESGTYDGVDWDVTDNVLTLGKAGETQTLTDRSYRTAADWPWHEIEDIRYVKLNGPVVAQGSLAYMFSLADTWELDLTGLDTTNATIMSYMFAYCCADMRFDLDLSMLDTSNVIDMSYMFYHAEGLSSIDTTGWNTSKVLYMNYMFCGCYSIASDTSTVTGIHDSFVFDLSHFDTSKVTDMAGMFSLCSAPIIDISTWDTSHAFMYRMFNGCEHLKEVRFPTPFDMSKNPFLDYMFAGCPSLVSIDLSAWDTSGIWSMEHMFDNCTSLETVNISTWDVSSCSNFSNMFRGCRNLKNIDVSNWALVDVLAIEPAISVSGMFDGCASLTNIDVNDWDTSRISQCSNMFKGCTGLTSLDLSNWILLNVVNASGMFHGCTNLKILDISSLHFENATNLANMFNFCKELVQVELGAYNPFIGIGNATCLLPATTQTTEYKYTGKWVQADGTYGPYTPEELRDNYTADMAGTWILEKDIPNAYAVFVNDNKTLYFIKVATDDIYTGGTTQTIRSVSGDDYTGIVYPVAFDESRTWSAVAPTTKHVVVVDELTPIATAGWFSSFAVCEDFDLDNLDTSYVIDMSGMFSGCSGMTSFTMSDIDTSKVEQMVSMFANCTSLTSMDLSLLDTSSAVNMNRMFSGCSSLISLDLSGFDMSNVVSIDSMFAQCTALSSLNTTDWDLSSLASMQATFTSCQANMDLDLRHWDVSHVTNMINLFQAGSFGEINLTGWDVSHVQQAGSFFQSAGGHLIAPDLHWSSLMNCSYMFYVRKGNSVLDIPRWSFGNVTSLYYLFAFGGGVVHAEDWNLEGVTSINNAFRQTNGDYDVGSYVYISGWHSNSVTNASYLFDYSGNVREIDVSGWDCPNITTIEEMFGVCSKLERIIGLDTWDVSRVTNMAMLFFQDSNLENVDLSRWTANISGSYEAIDQAFYNCSKMTRIEMPGITTSGVTIMSNVFAGCSNLEYLDISGFDATGLTSTYSGGNFTRCDNLRTVVLGDKNPFQSSTVMTSSMDLPTPPAERDGVSYSGKWVRDDYLYGPYTPAELRTGYQGVYEGTWIWDRGIGTGYTIIFEAPEGTLGAMPNAFATSSQVYYLPECAFRRPGATFSNWYDERNNYHYGAGSPIPAGQYQDGDVVILKAMFNGDGGEAVTMDDGTFEFSIKKNQKAIFAGLPAYTQYQIYEETPAGWMLVAEEGSSGIIQSEQMSTAEFGNKSIRNQCSLILSGEKFIDETRASKGEFQFELLDEDGNVVSTAVTGAGGNIVFDSLTFTEDDVGREIFYTVREVTPQHDGTWYSTGDENITYDTHEERIRVVVSYRMNENVSVLSHTENFDENGERLGTTVHLSQPIVRYYHTTNMDDEKNRDMVGTRNDGSIKGDYVSNKNYASLVRIPNAAKLHLRIEYTNPRGTFWLWSGYHEEVRTGSWSAECSPSRTLRTFSGSVYDEVFVEELDIDGDSFSCWYSSYALPTTATSPAWNETSNFGYHITVTVTELVKNGAVRSDGSLISDYVSNKLYSDVITVPGAEKLHVDVSYSAPRGSFYVWGGSYPQVANGYSSFDDTFGPSTALKSYPYVSGHENEVFSDEFDVEGDSLTLMYSSYAYLPSQTAYYGEYTDYGYVMKVTPINISDAVSDYAVYSSTPNVWTDGTQHGNYTAGRDYVQTVSIPGAKGLRFKVYFNMGNNDRLRLFQGLHPDYTNDTTANYVGYMTGTTSGYYTYGVSGDSATFVFHADANSTGGNGFGYYAVVSPTSAIGELHAEAIYDDDGVSFENQTSSGYLTLEKKSNSDFQSDAVFGFELSFYDDYGVAIDTPIDVGYHYDQTVLPENLLTVYHIGRKGDRSDVLYTERYPRIQPGETITVRAKDFGGYHYTENDYLSDDSENLSVEVNDSAQTVSLYYDALPYRLTVRHALLKVDGQMSSVENIDTVELFAGDPIVVNLNDYEGYAYCGNTYGLSCDDHLSGATMPEHNVTITVNYQVARVVNLTKAITGVDTTYHIELVNYKGKPVLDGITFVNNEADVLVLGDGTIKTLVLPASTSLVVTPVDTESLRYRYQYYYEYNYYGVTSLRESNNTNSGLKKWNISLNYVGPYKITFLDEDSWKHCQVQGVIRSTTGEEISTGSTSYYMYCGEPIGTLGRSVGSSSVSLNGVYYYFSGEQDVPPDTIFQGDDPLLTVKLYYVPSRKITVEYHRVASNGTEYMSTSTFTRAMNSPFVLNISYFYRYYIESVQCTTDSSIELTDNGFDYVYGTLKDSDITIRIEYRQQ